MVVHNAERSSTDDIHEAASSDEIYLFSQLEHLAEAIVLTIGEPLCEMVIHDFREPEHSIVWIRGQVTKRSRGGSMSQIGVAMLTEGDDATDRVNYITHTRDGRTLKSSTIALRDSQGHVFGAICLNLDITPFVAIEQTLHNFLALEGKQVHKNIQFSNNIAEVAHVMVNEALREIGLTGPIKDISQRQALVQALNRRGFFSIRNSISVLSEYLGISRASIYNYLKDVRDPIPTIEATKAEDDVSEVNQQ